MTDTKRYVARYHNETVMDVDLEFLILKAGFFDDFGVFRFLDFLTRKRAGSECEAGDQRQCDLFHLGYFSLFWLVCLAPWGRLDERLL